MRNWARLKFRRDSSGDNDFWSLAVLIISTWFWLPMTSNRSIELPSVTTLCQNRYRSKNNCIPRARIIWRKRIKEKSNRNNTIQQIRQTKPNKVKVFCIKQPRLNVLAILSASSRYSCKQQFFRMMRRTSWLSLPPRIPVLLRSKEINQTKTRAIKVMDKNSILASVETKLIASRMATQASTLQNLQTHLHQLRLQSLLKMLKVIRTK